MSRRVALLSVIGLLSLFGCSMTGSTSTTSNLKRPDGSTFTFTYTEVFTSLVSSVSMSESTDADGATTVGIASGVGTIKVTADRITVDDMPFADIPTDATTVTVNVAKGVITATADGKPLAKK